jgi:integrase
VPSILRHNRSLGHLNSPQLLEVIRLAHTENLKSNLGTKVSKGSDPITLCDFESILSSAPPGSKTYLEDISYIIFCLLCGARNITMRNITVDDIVQVTPLSGNKIAVTIQEKFRKNKLGDCLAELTFIGDTEEANNPLDFFFYFNNHLINSFRLDLLDFDNWKDARDLNKAFIWPITSDSFTARLKQYFKKAGLNADDISGHGLRHGYIVSGLLESRLSGLLFFYSV